MAANTTLAVASEWKREEIDLLKQTVAAGTTDLEFALFSKVCHRTGLDPFTRQIYAIKRKQQRDGQWIDVMTIQTGIDGYRVIAERTDEYLGGDEPAYGPACECGNKALSKHPEYATVTVRRWKHGAEHATTERADFDEYVQTKRDGQATAMWAKMPKRMIAKCAEALALRRAFPGLFEGVYTAEEMAQADSEHVIDVTPNTAPNSRPAQRAPSTPVPSGSTTPAAPPSTNGKPKPVREPIMRNDSPAGCPECGTGTLELVLWPNGDRNISCSDWRTCKYREQVPDESTAAEHVANVARAVSAASGSDVDPDAIPF